MTLINVYGHPVPDHKISSARIVSSDEAKRLLEQAKKDDEVRKRHGLNPWVKEGYDGT